jgi:hypothetical protein
MPSQASNGAQSTASGGAEASLRTVGESSGGAEASLRTVEKSSFRPWGQPSKMAPTQAARARPSTPTTPRNDKTPNFLRLALTALVPGRVIRSGRRQGCLTCLAHTAGVTDGHPPRAHGAPVDRFRLLRLEARANTMMHPHFPIAPRPFFPFALALVACAAIACGRSADLFPDDGQSNDGCVGALVCAPQPEPEPNPEPCADRACEGTTQPDIGTDGDGEPGELDPMLTDPTTAQPSDGLPGDPAESDPEPMPAGPQTPEPSELPPEAPPKPLPAPPVPDAGVGVDAGIEPAPGRPGPGRPPRPTRP